MKELQSELSASGLPIVRPQPATGSRRVQASRKRPREADDCNIASKVLRRQLGGRNARRQQRQQEAADVFRNLQLQGEYDAFADTKGMPSAPLWQRRSRVLEIVCAAEMVFVLCNSGLCTAFARVSGRRLCCLNLRLQEVIRSLFWNKASQSLITVSVDTADNYSSLKCRSTPAESIRSGKPQDSQPLFEDQALKWPGFVEFDDVNSKVLTHSAADGVYKVFRLDDYRHLFSIPDTDVQEVKISPGMLLMILNRRVGADGIDRVPLRVHHIEDGSVLKEFSHIMRNEVKTDFIEQFGKSLLVKQDGQSLEILDIQPARLQHTARVPFKTPTAFIFLYERNLFLTFREDTVSVWNFKGEQVTRFDDHRLYHADSHTSNIYITQLQDTILSYCKEQTPSASDGSCRGSIHISSILSGKCLARITPLLSPETAADRATHDALNGVTAMFFDEEHGEVWSGTKKGLVHKWSS